MTISHAGITALTLITLCLRVSIAEAGLTPDPLASTGVACDVNAVTITDFSANGGTSWNTTGTAIPASACLGAYEGNDKTYLAGSDNLGIKDDGLLNLTNYFPLYPLGAFIDSVDDLQNLDGTADDPGWIFAGRINFEDEGEVIENGTITNNDLSYTFDMATLLSLNCPNFDGGTCTDENSGTWTYTPLYNERSDG